jgi:hypothetical protein
MRTGLFQEKHMATPTSTRPRISLDLWAVIISLSLALIIRLGLIKTVPW